MAEEIDNYSDLEDGNENSGQELEESFGRAASHLQNIVSSVDNKALLQLYSFYKQATVGDCNTSKPNWYQITEKSKWESWNTLKGTSKHIAMSNYIKLVCDVDKNWKVDAVQGDKKKSEFWISVSSIENNETEISDSDKTIFDYCKDGDIDSVKSKIKPENVNNPDFDGLGLMHWASDRGNFEMLKTIISFGGEVNMKDNDGQTPLHYAASCDHLECVKLLLEHGADKHIKNCDDQLPHELPNDSIIKNLLM